MKKKFSLFFSFENENVLTQVKGVGCFKKDVNSQHIFQIL